MKFRAPWSKRRVLNDRVKRLVTPATHDPDQPPFLDVAACPARPTCKVVEDHLVPGAWRVQKLGYEAFAIFAGPNARQDAIDYAQQIFGEFDEMSALCVRSVPEPPTVGADRGRNHVRHNPRLR